MDLKGRVCFVVLCLFALMTQSCAKTEKEIPMSPPAVSEQKAPPVQKAAPSSEAPTNAVRAPAKRIDLTPAQLREMIAHDKDLFILDVRNPQELAAGPAPIENAVNIPLPGFSRRYAELPRDKDIVTVCLSGGRSALAADLLIQAGFTRVYNLAGGMAAWQADE